MAGFLLDAASIRVLRQMVRQFTREAINNERGGGTRPTAERDIRPVMLKATEAMAADDTEYTVKYLEGDGTETTATLEVRRPNGVYVADDDVGFLGRDTSFQAVFMANRPLPLYDATPTVTVGTTAETEAAQTDDWDVGDGSLKVVAQTRSAYADAGGEVLYGYYRDFYYDVDGRLTRVSAETRVTIDTPDACP